MSDLSVKTATFCFERHCQASADRVFRAFSDPSEKSRWQDSPDVQSVDANAGDNYLEFDFQVGGHERFAFEHGGTTYEYDAQYVNIVPHRRIVYQYEMTANGKLDSISLVAIEFAPNGNDSNVIYAEHGIFLDGIDDPAEREAGISDLLDNLTRFVSETVG